MAVGAILFVRRVSARRLQIGEMLEGNFTKMLSGQLSVVAYLVVPVDLRGRRCTAPA